MGRPAPRCDDWNCPARVSCALHVGRSAAFAALRDAPTRTYPRRPGRDCCPSYRFDRPKPWLALRPGQEFAGGLAR